jgi:predicted nucleotide-binding protein
VGGKLEIDIRYVIKELQSFGTRLTGEVLQAYRERGTPYGSERFSTWRKRLVSFLDANLPGESQNFHAKLRVHVFSTGPGESDESRFWRLYGEKSASYLDSLILDLEQGEYQEPPPPRAVKEATMATDERNRNQVFIVHGHDELLRTQAARFVEKLGLEAIILDEQATGGSKTIIEKIEQYRGVGFAIVLYTADDKGNDKESASNGQLNFRARQNVVLEHGYLMASLGREYVVPLIKGELELPSDIHGMVYVNDKNWEIRIAREMKSVGYEIDLNKLA